MTTKQNKSKPNYLNISTSAVEVLTMLRYKMEKDGFIAEPDYVISCKDDTDMIVSCRFYSSDEKDKSLNAKGVMLNTRKGIPVKFNRVDIVISAALDRVKTSFYDRINVVAVKFNTRIFGNNNTIISTKTMEYSYKVSRDGCLFNSVNGKKFTLDNYTPISDIDKWSKDRITELKIMEDENDD